MQIRTTGTVTSVKKQWWLKVNTKSFRTGPLDGAKFPHVIKVKYYVDGTRVYQKKMDRRSTPSADRGRDGEPRI